MRCYADSCRLLDGCYEMRCWYIILLLHIDIFAVIISSRWWCFTVSLLLSLLPLPLLRFDITPLLQPLFATCHADILSTHCFCRHTLLIAIHTLLLRFDIAIADIVTYIITCWYYYITRRHYAYILSCHYLMPLRDIIVIIYATLLLRHYFDILRHDISHL